jgi:hypothetical protein
VIVVPKRGVFQMRFKEGDKFTINTDSLGAMKRNSALAAERRSSVPDCDLYRDKICTVVALKDDGATLEFDFVENGGKPCCIDAKYAVKIDR